MSEPHSETWSGIFAGQPTAPKKIASCRPILLLPVFRHHALVLGVVVVGGEIEVILPQFEAELLRCGLEHAHALGHDLLADAVAGNDGDVIDAIGGRGAIHWVVSSRLTQMQ